MNYNEALDYIHSLGKFGSRPGLENISRLMNELGNPQDKLKYVHVAGTNGKGSTCSFLSSVLREAGLKTGLYISPFVVAFNERIQINGEYISDSELAEYTKFVKKAAEKIATEDNPITEFEFITALSFKYFADKACDIVVLEVGLGGRLDATNVIKAPLASVITRLDLDHTAILGDTIEKIAAEKCGIIKKGSHVITTADNDAKALEVIEKTSDYQSCSYTLTNPKQAEIIENSIKGQAFKYKNYLYNIKLLGKHQVSNALTAIETVEKAFPNIPKNVIAKGLLKTDFPARCEVISKDPVLILDGSHNPNGTAALNEVLNELKINDATAIVGFMADKDVKYAIGKVANHFSKMITVEVGSNPRTMSANELAEICEGFCSDSVAANSYMEAISLAKMANKPIIVFGSLYLSSDIRPLLLNTDKTL